MKWLKGLYYSFAVQLFIFHIRNNHILTFVWILLALFAFGQIGSLFGVSLLFVEPEFQGNVSFISFLIVGFSFGIFVMNWNLTTFLLAKYYFPFLASMAKPFRKYCFNNALIPTLFIITYLMYLTVFLKDNENASFVDIIIYIGGFLLGFFTFTISILFYFHNTNKDFRNFTRLKQLPHIISQSGPGRKLIDLKKNEWGQRVWRVDTYLTEFFKTRLVRSVSHYDKEILSKVFRQNHFNAFFAQISLVVILFLIGWLLEDISLSIPAAASIFLFLSIFNSFVGSFTYWFGRWHITVMFLTLFSINYLTGFRWVEFKNKAVGLTYEENNYVPYNYKNFDEKIQPEPIKRDKKTIISILENWKHKTHKEKPKMVFLCVSGGGLRAALWAMTVAQSIEKETKGKVLQNTALISGASGGMIGLSYFRELYHLNQRDNTVDYLNPKYRDNLSRDLLNPVMMSLVTRDILQPWAQIKIDGKYYMKDRGYAFEQQLNKNTFGILDKKLSDYAKPELNADIPMVFITPSILNDGRRLLISPHYLSFMMTPPMGVGSDQVGVDGIDFKCLFNDHAADSLSFLTALRMNATYPYVLPNVSLPTLPRIEVMDAGFRDNYGILSAVRFVHVFKDWINENTSGIIFVQINDKVKLKKIIGNEKDGIISGIFNPMGIPTQIITLQDYHIDANLGLMVDLLGKGMFNHVKFVYEPKSIKEQVSMTFHLTAKEKSNIQNHIYTKKNKASMQKLKSLLEVID